MDSWLAVNHRYLLARIRAVRTRLEQLAGESPADVPDLTEPEAALGGPSALEQVSRAFGLSRFEEDVLVLSAGVELDAKVGALCGRLHGDSRLPVATFGLAVAALPEAHWDAIAPGSPLRAWSLLTLGTGDVLTRRPLRIDERILHHMTGVSQLDERLRDDAEPACPPEPLAASQQAVADSIANAFAAGTLLAHLTGPDSDANRAVATAACAAAGLPLWMVDGARLPKEIAPVARLWEREQRLTGCALLIDARDMDSTDPAWPAITALVDRLPGPALVTSRDRRPAWRRQAITVEVGKPTRDEQRVIWAVTLGDSALASEAIYDQLTAQFDLGTSAIRRAAREAREAQSLRAVWDASRGQARPRLDDLVQRLEPAAAWDDLVLPEEQCSVLRQIAIHVRQRAQVYDRWGFGARGSRGLGISALFAGPSGTGKTTAAEVLANELRLDLYRIDLATVVSKYIGETEKNLRRVFDAAEDGGAILLFDEADALFGKRSDVKDSHDRYANIEIGYLLQRMESYRGLAILTTNLKSVIDSAFLRRIRFVVHFPFPDAVQREQIWRKAFPPQTPVNGINPALLAQLSIAGGNIHNIALGAAFLAAEDAHPVTMDHILQAAKSEYAKIEKVLTDAETRGWGDG